MVGMDETRRGCRSRRLWGAVSSTAGAAASLWGCGAEGTTLGVLVWDWRSPPELVVLVCRVVRATGGAGCPQPFIQIQPTLLFTGIKAWVMS